MKFTPLELAKLLGDRDAQHRMGYDEPAHFRVILEGDSKPREMSRQAFERAFEIIYSPFLTFKSLDNLRATIASCPYILRASWLATDNYTYARRYFAEIWSGKTADVSVRWLDPVYGYGLFAETEISEGGFIGVYTGVVRALSKNLGPLGPNGYCLHYPTSFLTGEYLAIDALREGNLLRFMNHSDTPNVEPLCAVDRGLLQMVFVAKGPIAKGEELTFDYGNDYWERRWKS